MKEIRDRRLSFEEASALLGREVPDGWWELLVRRLRYPDLRLDVDKRTLTLPEYVPIVELLTPVLEEVDRGDVDARPCLACGSYFDVNTEDGIFSRPDELEGFVCEGCARGLTAWDFFHRHMARSG